LPEHACGAQTKTTIGNGAPGWIIRRLRRSPLGPVRLTPHRSDALARIRRTIIIICLWFEC